MQGIQSLMQAPQGQAPMQGGPMQGPMPGQAPMPGMMPGMMPQQGAPTPQAMTGSLKNMPLEQLRMLYQNPQPGNPPLWAVISALAEKQKEAQAMMAAQGQSAMAQNAQMQQQPPVAAQVVQAAEQMEPQGYAGGGAVAFRDAGVVGLQNPEYDEEGLPRTNEERQRIERNNRIFLEQQRNAEAFKRLQASRQAIRESSQVTPKQMQDFYRSTGREKLNIAGAMGAAPAPAEPPMAAPTSSAARPTTFDITSPSSINALRMAAQDTSLPEAERADLQRRIAMMEQQPPSRGIQSVAPAAAPAAQPALAPQAGLSPEMEAYFRNRMSELGTRQGLPEDILAGRAGLEALARESIAAQRGEAETFGREARERRDAALARAQRSILNDPQALLALAGSIDTRKGQGIGSLARGAAGLMSQREAAAEAAREKYATAQQTERALQANVRQATMLEAQRAQAVREGDFNRANQIKDQIDALMLQRETLMMERKDKAIEQARLERGVAAQEYAARRPTEFEQYQAAPDQYSKFVAAKTPGKSPYDMIMDNVRADYKIWADSMQGKLADPVAQKAKLQELYTYHVAKARAQGVQLPAGAEGPAAAQNDPLGLR